MDGLHVKDYGRPEPPARERTWTTDELQAEFEVLGFAAPFTLVRRRADGVRGTVEFSHSPRLYFGWVAA